YTDAPEKAFSRFQGQLFIFECSLYARMCTSFGHNAKHHERLLTGVELERRKGASHERLQCV
ncbi:MAG: hypothetical protein WAV85_18530, partial [Rhodoferax sp.]